MLIKRLLTGWLLAIAALSAMVGCGSGGGGASTGASSAAGAAATAGAGSTTGGGGGSTRGGSGTTGTSGGSAGAGAGAAAWAGGGGAAGGASSTGAGAADCAGLMVLTSRGGPRTGAVGLGGSAFFGAAVFFAPPPLAGAGVSANMSPLGSEMPRCRAMRSTNDRATTSSMVLDALFNSMP